MLPPGWNALGFTSGSRTYLGNKKVGGVKSSGHLDGTAADFTASPAVLRARFPNARILDEGDHRHVSGLADVPYYGRNGTAGLVNGVDTTAPKGGPMIRPRKQAPPQPLEQLRDAPINLAASPLVGEPDMASLMPPSPTLKPAKPKFFSKEGLGPIILGIIGDTLAQRSGGQASFMPMYQNMKDQEYDREKFNQQLAAKREEAMAKAAEPPAFVRNAQVYAALPEPIKQQVGQFYSVTNPQFTTVRDAEGREFRGLAPPSPGAEEGGYIFIGGDPADPQNWKAR